MGAEGEGLIGHLKKIRMKVGLISQFLTTDRISKFDIG